MSVTLIIDVANDFFVVVYSASDSFLQVNPQQHEHQAISTPHSSLLLQPQQTLPPPHALGAALAAAAAAVCVSPAVTGSLSQVNPSSTPLVTTAIDQAALAATLGLSMGSKKAQQSSSNVPTSALRPTGLSPPIRVRGL